MDIPIFCSDCRCHVQSS